MELDVTIFGGGAAGLWLLDELAAAGARAVLLEAGELGANQTAWSQGILHGGLKYSLRGVATIAARQVSLMPLVWRDCLAGRRAPALSETRLRAEFCYLWHTRSLASRAGFFAARHGLAVAPEPLPAEQRPPLLADCPGAVARLGEQVISPVSLIENLFGRNRDRILKIDPERGLEFARSTTGDVAEIRLQSPHTGARAVLRPRFVILTAGAGNARLRGLLGLDTAVMQRRPLHMALVRGKLPEFNGHCVDGGATRVTITSDTDRNGHTVWQIGGQIAETAVLKDRSALIALTRAELSAVLPRLELRGLEWGAYRVDRADRATRGGSRPSDVQTLREGNILTAWPTKLVLVPRLSSVLRAHLGELHGGGDWTFEEARDWPRPKVAQPPWEVEAHWQPASPPVPAPHFLSLPIGASAFAPNLGK